MRFITDFYTYLSGSFLLFKHLPYESIFMYFINSATYESRSRGVWQSDCTYKTGANSFCLIVLSNVDTKYFVPTTR